MNNKKITTKQAAKAADILADWILSNIKTNISFHDCNHISFKAEFNPLIPNKATNLRKFVDIFIESTSKLY